MNRVLITGANGMLGMAVTAVFSRHVDVVSLGRKELDICDEKEVRSVFEDEHPDVVVNCAAYTDVDGAEKNFEEAYRVNALGAGNIARAAKLINAKFVHISTDYVFDGSGSKPYREDYGRAPINAYGKTKAKGEEIIEEEGGEFLIVRTSWLFGPYGKNFVKTILGLSERMKELRIVDDQRGSPTYTHHLADGIFRLCSRGANGIFHFSNTGECTWFEFAEEIISLAGKNTKLVPVSTKEFPREAQRPSYSVLDTTKYQSTTGHRPPHWKDGLRDYLQLIKLG